MGNAKPGQRVGHRGTPHTGVVKSVIRGIARVVWSDGSESQVHTTSLHKKGGPCLVWAVGFLLLTVGFVSGTTYLIL